MINYYEILEVSEKASKEVIEKAYKALAKKYHPDLNHDNPKEAEHKMKELNEAFDILMDENKRANFDSILAKKRELDLKKQIQNRSDKKNTTSSHNVSNVNSEMKASNTISYSKNGYYTDMDNNFYVNTTNMDERTKRKLQNKLQERYLEAYDSYLRERGYKLKYKWTFKRVMTLVLAIIITILIFVILFFIPPIHDYFVELYETNIIVRLVVNLFSSIFHTIFG